ncbi:lipid ABC transporter permease/ATP-binding protein, partial [Erwinia amylovora]|uniref:ATP-binding cassette domain-containing protein n=1 Tax=Erwinia amylovora TaxID=552 RepID=UPI0034A55BB5|nr:lipid ABC transporter permease/ATP-binding protein [Erwinia amylovora]
KTVELVGRSGSVKSTMASLLSRFYYIQHCSFMMDGHDMRVYTLASLRNQGALEAQTVHLLTCTVDTNIAYAREEQYSREDMEKAATM